MPSTAPKWAQTIGLTTRNQALQFQARAMGYESRAQLERYRKVIIGESPEAARRWRALLQAQTVAEILQTRESIARAHALKRELNDILPMARRLGSPKVRAR